MDEKEKIMGYIRMKGPSLPVEIAKYIQKDSILVSAYLSELSAAKRIKLSHLKVGRSKLYYQPGQESKLQDFSKYLSEKDRRTYEYLQKDKILRDKDLDPLSRLSLSNMKDFAIPLEVNFQDIKEIFWKWYLLPTDEAAKQIKERLGLPKVPPEEKIEPVKAPIVPEQDLTTEEKVSDNVSEESDQGVEDIDEEKEDQFEEDVPEEEQVENIEPEDSPLFKEEINDDFARMILNYFSEKEIATVKHEIIRKNSDIDFIIMIPSPVGKLKYYCKARKKKSINDADISQAYVNGQLKKLPVIFISTGKPTKKADILLENDLNTITYVQVD